MHVHVAAVEQRIALGQQDHVATLRQVRHEPGRGLLVELLDRRLVAARVVGGLRGDRVDELFLDLVAAQVRRGDRPRDRTPVPRRVIRHDVGGADEPRGLHRDKLRVAGARAPRRRAPRPRVNRPRSRWRLPRRRSSRCRRAARAPPGAQARGSPAPALIPPRRRTRPGCQAPRRAVTAAASEDLQQPEQRGRRVADRHDGAVEPRPHRSRPPPTCVVPSRSARPATAGSPRVQMTSLPAGSRARVMPERDHLRVA